VRPCWISITDEKRQGQSSGIDTPKSIDLHIQLIAKCYEIGGIKDKVYIYFGGFCIKFPKGFKLP